MSGFEGSGHLGRVAVLDRHGGARRVLRALGELAAAGRVEATVAIHAPTHRSARFVREADEAVELDGSLEEALLATRATTAWLGPASLEERAAFAAACESAGVVPVGPGAASLRRLVGPRAVRELAAELGVAPDDEGKAQDASLHLVEVVAACDGAGAIRVVGAGDASLVLGDVAVFAESPAPALAAREEEGAFALAERVLAALAWRGVGAVRFAARPGSPRLALSAVDAFARSAPAVEEASGVDLVRLAFRLAGGGTVERGRPLRRGHALAVRIQSRDPEGERARTGKVELIRLPSGPGVRAHAALAEGDEAPPGAVLATVVAVGEERAEAAARLELALAESDVLVRGSATSRAFLRGLLARREVRGGHAGRGFLEALVRRDEELVRPNPDVALLAAAIEVYEGELEVERARFIAEARRGRPRVGPSAGRDVELRWRGHRHRFEVRQTGPDAYCVTPGAGGAPADVRVERLGGAERRLGCLGRRWRILSAVDGLRHLVEVDGVPHAVERMPTGIVPSPIPAVVVAIPVVAGQQVSAGDPVARIESMKVEMVVTAPAAGIVREVLTVANAQVDAGAPLVRIDPPGERPARSAPPRPAAPAEPGPAPEPPPRARYLAALDELRRLALGFDVSPADARRLALRWREAADPVARDDGEVLRAEERVALAFADVQSLYSRARRPDGPETPPPLEELWRYLHEPERRGEGLSARFVAALRSALSHYGLSLDEPGRALEIALLRMQKAYERADEQLPAVLAILERRLAGEGVPPGGGPGSRALLDALAEIGEERFPALADLARELRYRRFDQPALEQGRRAAYAQAEADLARLGEAQGAEREALVERLVAIAAPFATLLVRRMAEAPPPLRPRLVETLLRRYYRARPLSPAVAREQDGVPCALADYAWAGEQFRAAACFARTGDAAIAARQLARLAAEAPEERAVAGELYLWHDGEPLAMDAQAEALRAALATAPWPRPPVRVSVVLAFGGRGLGRRESQQHFTFRADGAWTEDRRYRGIHPMLFRRMQLTRLDAFELERLPSAEDVYLFRGVARENPKDERLFAAAEVRELTPVRDAAGVVRLPQLERVLHEALAGMRRFQAHREPHQRLEWNRVLLTVTPPLPLSREEIRVLAERLAPATQGVGLEMVLIEARIPDPATGELADTLLRIVAGDRGRVSIRWDEHTNRPLQPMSEYQQRVVQLRRRGLVHPFEIVRQLAPEEPQPGVPRGTFVEHDLDASGEALVPVERPPGRNAANVVAGVVTSFTERHPEGMRRVVLLGDPSRAMGSLAEPECRRIAAAIALADRLRVPLEWFAVSAGAKISMESGTENMDWISVVLRRIVEFTQRGGEINVVVTGINVGAQPYWNAEATMLMHTRGILVMTPGSAMVLTGKEALEYSGSVSAEDNQGIGGYDRIMGPNGQAQYRVASVGEAIQLLVRHYEHTWVAPSERFPRKALTADPADRDVRSHPHVAAGGAGLETVGDVFSAEKNPDRKKPFDVRSVMSACIDQDHAPLERWRDLRGGETAVVWDAHLGGRPVCLLGIESRPLPRLEFVPADGPELWSAGTLFPQSSKKIARALNAASGNRPVVVLANLSGFDGSPESMRRLQLEYGAEIGRAVVNFDGPILFCVISRYHGGSFVVFSKMLRADIEVVAVEGARASVIGGAPAAAVVFAREVEARMRKDPRVRDAEQAAARSGAARARLEELVRAVRSEKVGEVAEEFDAVHTVERALAVGSLDRIITARELRPYLVEAVERRIAACGR